jgi:hypothetical protein
LSEAPVPHLPPVFPAAPKNKKSRRKLAIIGGSVLALVLIGGIAGGEEKSQHDTASERPTTTVAEFAEDGAPVPGLPSTPRPLLLHRLPPL